MDISAKNSEQNSQQQTHSDLILLALALPIVDFRHPSTYAATDLLFFRENPLLAHA